MEHEGRAIALLILMLAVLIGVGGGTLLGLSMVPRAEIAMVVMQRGTELEAVGVSDSIFAGVVFVCAVTSALTPFVLRPMLRRFGPS